MLDTLRAQRIFGDMPSATPSPFLSLRIRTLESELATCQTAAQRRCVQESLDAARRLPGMRFSRRELTTLAAGVSTDAASIDLSVTTYHLGRPPEGVVLSGKFRLPSGERTDRFFRSVDTYRGATLEPVSGVLGPWRLATEEETQDFEDCERDTELERDAYPETIAAALDGGRAV